MTPSHRDNIAIIERPTARELGRDPVSWLQQLKRTTWIDIPGKDASRCRVITTLLHGNEPSGVIALHRWLKQQKEPAVNISLLIAAVETALYPPLFSHRMLAGERDLNRCFKAPYNDRPGRLAQLVIERINQLKPECIVDIHNTSGSGPSFAVATDNLFELRALSRCFCRRMIVTDLRLGSLMEVHADCPVVTIECGGAKDSESENTALAGIDEITQTTSLFADGADNGLEILLCPVRIELRPNVSIAYNDKRLKHVDITLWPNIEYCNHGITRRDRCLGWVGPGGLDRLTAENAAGINQLPMLLREHDGWLYPAEDLQIFMATTNVAIAQEDCLFYAVIAS